MTLTADRHDRKTHQLDISSISVGKQFDVILDIGRLIVCRSELARRRSIADGDEKHYN